MVIPMNCALINASGTVTNVIVVDPAATYAPPGGLTLQPIPADEPVSIGWTFADGHFIAPPPQPTPPPTHAEQQAARLAAYRAEADPLFFKAQRGEATTAEWQAKIDEIRLRFPYPADQ